MKFWNSQDLKGKSVDQTTTVALNLAFKYGKSKKEVMDELLISKSTYQKKKKEFEKAETLKVSKQGRKKLTGSILTTEVANI